jgi:hypothetical protein
MEPTPNPSASPPTAEDLGAHVGLLGRTGMRLTLEASLPARWAAKLLRHLLGELLESRDQCREAKAHIEARFRQWGVIQLHGKALFAPAKQTARNSGPASAKAPIIP